MSDVRLEERLPVPTLKRFGIDVKRRIYPIAGHAIATCTTILAMTLTELILNWTLGHDFMLFDQLPVRYVIHAVDLITFARFAINVWRELR